MDEASILALLIERARAIGVNVELEPNAHRRMVQAAQKAAGELAEAGRTEVNLPFLGVTPQGPVHLLVSLPDGAAGGPRLDPREKLS